MRSGPASSLFMTSCLNLALLAQMPGQAQSLHPMGPRKTQIPTLTEAGFAPRPLRSAPLLESERGLWLHPNSPLDGNRSSHGVALQTTPPLQTTPALRRGPSEAIVEVWDLSFPVPPADRSVLVNLNPLNRPMSWAMRTSFPRHGDLDLAYLMLSDPAQPQSVDLAKVRSLHVRFNRLPPSRNLPR